MHIENSIVLITGASSGIGKATAIAAVEGGARVALIARRADLLDDLAAGLGAAALALPCDVTDQGQIAAAIAQTMDRFGRIDALVNNAGRGFYAPVATIDLTAYRDLLALNTIAPLAMMQAVIPGMQQQGHGAIVNVSSGATFGILPGAAAYSSSKTALNMMSDVARLELAAAGIAVSTLYPFVTDTGFYDAVQAGQQAADAEIAQVGKAAHDARRVADKILGLIRSGDRQDDLVPKAYGGSLAD